jgi:4'-phosphopantetheinyl transferase
MIMIFYGYLNSSYQQLLMDKYMPQFPDEFQQRILSFHRWQDAQAAILGRLFTQQGIKLYNFNEVDDEIVYNNYGKPRLRYIPLHFNISHTNNVVVCAFSYEEIGIDIEKITNIDMETFKPHLTKSEWDQIQTSKNKLSEFYNFWTKKEAIIKLMGKGLSIPLNSFEVIANVVVIENRKINIEPVPINNNYVCNVATFSNTNKLNVDIKEVHIGGLL